MGRRSGKTIGGTTTGYVYDGDNFIQELNGTANTSTVKAQLITGGIDETFLREEGNNLHTLLSDANNNTIRILDNTQAKVVDYSYEPYGTTTADTTNANSQQYTGRENDNPGNPNGLYYYRARYYMPGCARFISEDPIGWASGQTNNYSYVGGDPVSFTDPSGLCAGSAFDEFVGHYVDTMKTIDTPFERASGIVDIYNDYAPSFLELTPPNVTGWALGSWMAKHYGGQTIFQARATYARQRAIPTLFGRKPAFNFGGVARTTALNYVLLKGSLSAGVVLGSALYTAYDRMANCP